MAGSGRWANATEIKPTFDNKVSIINVVLPPGFGHFIY